MDNNREWPIAPTFLSLRQGCTEGYANYNTDGIYCIACLLVFPPKGGFAI